MLSNAVLKLYRIHDLIMYALYSIKCCIYQFGFFKCLQNHYDIIQAARVYFLPLISWDKAQNFVAGYLGKN